MREDGLLINVLLNLRNTRKDRFDLEQDIIDQLERVGFDFEDVGGGTLTSREGEILEVDFDYQFANATKDHLESIIAEIKKVGVPSGSKVIVPDDGREFLIVWDS